MHPSYPLKIGHSISLLVSHRPLPLSNFASDIGNGLPDLVNDGSGNIVCIPWSSAHDSCVRCSSTFGSQMLMK